MSEHAIDNFSVMLIVRELHYFSLQFNRACFVTFYVIIVMNSSISWYQCGSIGCASGCRKRYVVFTEWNSVMIWYLV